MNSIVTTTATVGSANHERNNSSTTISSPRGIRLSHRIQRVFAAVILLQLVARFLDINSNNNNNNNNSNNNNNNNNNNNSIIGSFRNNSNENNNNNSNNDNNNRRSYNTMMMMTATIISSILRLLSSWGGEDMPFYSNAKEMEIRDEPFSMTTTAIEREKNEATTTTTAGAAPPPVDLQSSWFHCVGDNWEANAYVYRSCQFHNLCWSVRSPHKTNNRNNNNNIKSSNRIRIGHFFLFSSPTLRDLNRQHQHQRYNNNTTNNHNKYARISTASYISSNRNITFTSDDARHGVPLMLSSSAVSPIGQTLWWSRKRKFEWFPTILDDDDDGDDKEDDHSKQPSPSRHQQPTFHDGGPKEHVVVWQLPKSMIWIPIYLPSPIAADLRWTKRRKQQPQPSGSSNNNNSNKNLLLLPSVWTMLTETLFPMFQLYSMFVHDDIHHYNDNTVMVQILNRRDNDDSHNNNNKNNNNTTSPSDSSSTCWSHASCQLRWKTVMSTFMNWHIWEDSMIDPQQQQQQDEFPFLTSSSSLSLTSSSSSSFSSKTMRRATTQVDNDHVLVCGRGVAGMGSLTDHGWLKRHGERGKDYHVVHNVGRGNTWWKFRNYILKQQQRKQQQESKVNEKVLKFDISWAMPTPTPQQQEQPSVLSLPRVAKCLNQLLVSQYHATSTSTKHTNNNNNNNNKKSSYQDAWEFAVDTSSSQTMAVRINDMNLAASHSGRDRDDENNNNNSFRSMLLNSIRLASVSRIYITIATSGEEQVDYNHDSDTASLSSSMLWPALFLPRGATLFLYYDETQIVSLTKRKSRPRMLHFDVWNNLSHLRVHWLPLPKASNSDDNDDDNDRNKDMSILIHLMEDAILELFATEKQKQATHSRKATATETMPPVASARWNGMNLYLKAKATTASSSSSSRASTLSSKIHCVGENFRPWESYMYQSCHFEHLCLDVKNDSYFLIQSPRQEQLAQLLLEPSWNNRTDHALLSTEAQVFSKRLAVGHNVRLSNDNEWFPQLRSSSSGVWALEQQQQQQQHQNEGYWELDSNVVWLPFFPQQPNINNPGHLLWDFFLPMFTLLAMFDMENKELFLTNLGQECSASDPPAASTCYNLVTKFLPMLGVAPASFGSVRSEIIIQLQNSSSMSNNKFNNDLLASSEPITSIICTRNAVAGLGMLTDHGLKRHGQGMDDYSHVHNVGRGADFYQFRNHILRHLGLDPSVGISITNKPYQTVFSINSSKNPSRRRDFAKQISTVQSSFSLEELSVKDVVISTLPLKEQLRLMTETFIFVSVIGGATSTATFLPLGSCLILYFNDVDDFVDNKIGGRPNMMDWDFWNNASYLRVHWLPIKSMDEAADLEMLRLLIRHEIHIGSTN